MDEKQMKFLPTVGTLVGALIAYIVRPEAPQIGKLPLEVVMTRGAKLNGVDEIIIATAETSFNYVIIGAVIGAIIGMAIFWFMIDQTK